MEKLLKPYTLLFALFCASLPFTDLSKAIPNIVMGLLVLLFGFVVKKEDLKKLHSKTTLLLGLFCLSLFFNIIISGRWEDFGFLTNILITLLIIILSIPITNHIIPLKAFVFSSFTLLLISSFNFLSYYLTTTDFDFNSGAHINDILMGERPYLGVIYIACACICWFLAKQTHNKKQVILWYFMSICFVVFVALIAARTALISFFIILLASSFYFKRLKLAIGTLCGTLLFGFLLISFNENIKNRFFFSERKSSINEKLVYEPRYHIWNCAGDIKHDTYSFILGKGFRTTQRELLECYKSKEDFGTTDQKQWFIQKNFNTHNQYLEFYLSAGILSSICFVLMLLFTFLDNRTNYFATSLILLIMLFLVTENLIHRQIGVMLMGIVFSFINFMNQKNIISPK